MTRSYMIAAGVALVSIAWVASGQLKGDEPSNVETVTTTQITEPVEENMPQVRATRSLAREHDNSVVLFGRTEGVRSVKVKVQTSGRIVAINVEKGSRVNKGDVIAHIEMADRQARLKESKALVERYSIAYEAAKKLSQKQFRSKVQLAEAVSNLETARSGLRSIQLDIERTAIRAPFDGVLDDLLVDVGDFVAVGDVTASVVDLDPILFVGEVTERVASRLSLQDKAIVTPVDGEPQEGVVSYISKVGSTATRTFRVEISLANPDANIPEGLTAELHLKLGSIKGHFVTPAVLTLNDAGVLGIKTVDKEGLVQFNKVTIIDDTPQGIWLTGLPDQADVIVVGQEFVRSGQKVRTTFVESEKG